MAVFEYQALTTSGRLMTGTIEASSPDQAREQLSEMMLTVNHLDKAAPERPKTAIGRNEFMLFNQQLAALTKAGIPLEKGMRELANDVGSVSMRRLVNEIAGELESGKSIEDAFEGRRGHFPELYGHILKAGVDTGRLSEMLTSLNRHLEISGRTRRIIFEALCYPLVVLSMAAVITTVMFLVVVPQFEKIFGEFGVTLPLPTQIILNIPKHVLPFWIIVGIFVGIFFFFSVVLSASPGGRRFKESIYLSFPVLGQLYHSSILARMADAKALLIGAACDMPTALRLSANAAGSEKLKLEADLIAKQIENGNPVLEAGQFCRVIPRIFLYSMQLGIQRNELQDNLYSLSEMYSQQVRCHQSKLQAFLMPLMLILVGFVIMFSIISLFLPLIKMVETLSG
ncbi:MAG: type II secretion system F family protein [Planctomycetes bacterium]|nr:type II secretion system F family protein [Planctomycetota bacterium]